MTIIIDSREQKPLVFGCDWVRKKLHVGDYGAKFSENHIHSTIFERKGISDLFSTLSTGYFRFRKEIDRAEKSKTRLIIAIEGTEERVLKGCSHSARDPKSILVQLETINRKYGVSAIFFPSRIAMQNYIVDYYVIEYEKYLETIASLPEEL